jgi:ATP-dependent RNA helicase SUPV3L1/SUV3
MLNAAPKQITLKEDGRLYYQGDPTNPLPGDPVAYLAKGDTIYAPKVAILPEIGLDDTTRPVVQTAFETWMGLYMAATLGPLMRLPAELENLPAPVQTICTRVYDEFGIVPRADIADLIAALDTDMRKQVRAKQIRLGPVLVFVNELTRPAAVKLRAILWALYHDKALPMVCPRDGAVSQVIEDQTADTAFYQTIGYPLYGGRAIRIDMLDRVITAIYDSVKDNKFQAQHKMAEWLGCSVPDLYKVLEAMGHKKVHDPAEDVKPTEGAAGTEDVKVTEEAESPEVVDAVAEPAVDTAVSEGMTGEVPVADGAEEAKPATAAAASRPELATFKVFWPRKARAADEAPRARKPRRAPKSKMPPPIEKLSPEEMAAKQAEWQARDASRAAARAARDDKKSDEGNKGARKTGGNAGGKGGGGNWSSRKDEPFRTSPMKKVKPSKMDKTMRTISASAPKTEPADNPFAILGTLNFKGK